MPASSGKYSSLVTSCDSASTPSLAYSLSINSDWIGDVYVDSDWNYEEDRFEFNGEIKRGILPSFVVDGVLYGLIWI